MTHIDYLHPQIHTSTHPHTSSRSKGPFFVSLVSFKFDLVPSQVVASPEMFASAPNALAFDETKLIDLPLAEQRRRGNELLSMLSETGFGFS